RHGRFRGAGARCAPLERSNPSTIEEHSMNTNILRNAVLALGLAAAGFAFAQTGRLSGSDILQRVERAGYSDVRDLEFDDGLWEVKARDGDGRPVELLVDPDSGAIIDPRATPALGAEQIRGRLEAL